MANDFWGISRDAWLCLILFVDLENKMQMEISSYQVQGSQLLRPFYLQGMLNQLQPFQALISHTFT